MKITIKTIGGTDNFIIDSLEDGLQLLKKYEDAGHFEKSYPVQTPVTSTGNIIFNNGNSALTVDQNGLQIESLEGKYLKYNEKFKWVECKREDLKPGDTAYKCDNKESVFDNRERVCKIKNSKEHYYIINHDINKSSCPFNHWYKLTKK